MTDDSMQGMLFGSIDPSTSNRDAGTGGQLQLCALNSGSPGPARAQQLIDWLLTTGANTLVLTEMQPTGGGKLIMSGLAAEGFTTHAGLGWKDSRYFTLAATRGFTSTGVQPDAFDPRIIAVDLASGDATVRLVGVYGPANGMSADSSVRRRLFQARLLQYLKDIGNERVCLTGDLNVVEPGHVPHLASFEDHDYSFYTGLLGLGLADAYRALNPSGGHSWPRLTDHAALLTTVQLAAAS
jgi:exodeoxyribonuclease-3